MVRRNTKEQNCLSSLNTQARSVRCRSRSSYTTAAITTVFIAFRHADSWNATLWLYVISEDQSDTSLATFELPRHVTSAPFLRVYAVVRKLGFSTVHSLSFCGAREVTFVIIGHFNQSRSRFFTNLFTRSTPKLNV